MTEYKNCLNLFVSGWTRLWWDLKACHIGASTNSFRGRWWAKVTGWLKDHQPWGAFFHLQYRPWITSKKNWPIFWEIFQSTAWFWATSFACCDWCRTVANTMEPQMLQRFWFQQWAFCLPTRDSCRVPEFFDCWVLFNSQGDLIWGRRVMYTTRVGREEIPWSFRMLFITVQVGGWRWRHELVLLHFLFSQVRIAVWGMMSVRVAVKVIVVLILISVIVAVVSTFVCFLWLRLSQTTNHQDQQHH